MATEVLLICSRSEIARTDRLCSYVSLRIDRLDDKESCKREIIQQGAERFMLKVFGDGREEREPIAKLPRKKRYPPRPYWQWDLSKLRKKDF